MMLYPPVSDLVEKIGSRYLLVNVVAKRAREIANLAEDSEMALEKKPVSVAIDEAYSGRLTVKSKNIH